MTGDAFGAQYGPNTTQVERLLSDARVLGPSGIERMLKPRPVMVA